MRSRRLEERDRAPKEVQPASFWTQLNSLLAWSCRVPNPAMQKCTIREAFIWRNCLFVFFEKVFQMKASLSPKVFSLHFPCLYTLLFEVKIKHILNWFSTSATTTTIQPFWFPQLSKWLWALTCCRFQIFWIIVDCNMSEIGNCCPDDSQDLGPLRF